MAMQPRWTPPPSEPPTLARRRRIRTFVVIGIAGLLGLLVLSTLMTPVDPKVAAQPSPGATAPASPGQVASPMRSTGLPASSDAAGVPTEAAPTTTDVAFAPTGSTQTGFVTRVIDGDTVVVEIDGVQARVRYIGMDTLEPNDPDPALRRMADAATAANRTLVDGRDVILERDVSETDRFDRLLRNVWVRVGDGALVMVGLELVRQGFAQLDTFPPDVKYVDVLRAVQDDARAAQVGLWETAPSEPIPIPIPTPKSLLDPGATGRAGCDDSYPEVCIPAYPPDLDCGEIMERNFIVRGPDPHGFDREGDGLGCEGA